MSHIIIVEGKNDRERLKKILSDEVSILCTYGTLNTKKIEKIKEQSAGHHIYIFTDNDASGKKIRGV